ncbi:MAG TPA: FAD-containing oxidoreductase [Xanthobacteraceae bacterium]|jgi:pyruvate/2-oxoglutarate dehydrogenase complex dihydrolipoamide dehydrogenase (E3) component|nr:FAD-containing oxidoreductase [Xanthobacteraceae bacterium]
MPDYDAIIIGTGQSGPALARRLVAAGSKVAILERKLFGGTCVNTGCTPTKTLIASAYAAHIARRAADYGVTIAGAVKVDMKAVKARKDAVVAPSHNGVERSLKTLAGCTVYEGHGRFVAEKKVAVNGSEITADRIFINVGARAAIPPILGLDRVPYLTNSSMMDIDFLPPHLVILGGSYIGLEFGQAYRRFGSEVTVIELGPRLIAREDADVSQAVADFLKEEGIDVRVDSKVIAVEKQGNAIAVKIESAGKTSAGKASQVVGTHVLVAIGRRPNTDDLGLDKAGIATDKHGYIQVDDQLRTNVSGIWAMGDCNGRGAFTHTSWNDFEIVAANLLDNDQKRVSDRISAYALYTDPPLGRAGMTEAEVRKTGKPALISTLAMEDVSRAYEKGETKGFMKILVDRDSKQILGASFLGLSGDEVIHCVLDVMYAKAPYTVMQRAMHIHPTVSEFIPTMLGDLKPLQ